MFVQLLLGTALILSTIIVAGLGFLVIETMLTRFHGWLIRPPHALKMLTLLCVSVTWFLLIVSISVWIWGFAFLSLGLFEHLEEAIYFATVSFTTLGFGDILLPQDWRLLSGIASVNGLLMIGLQTAMLIEILRRVRTVQGKVPD